MSPFVIEVFFPNYTRPVRIVRVSTHPFLEGPERWAVYRPAYSSRGNTCNDVRREYKDLAAAWKAAHMPLPANVVRRDPL